MTMLYAIVELEEGSLTVSLGKKEGGQPVVLQCRRFTLPDLGRDQLVAVLRSGVSDLLEGVEGVHVVLGERRMQHFLTPVPKLPARALSDFVAREALRISGMASLDEVLFGARIVRRLPGQRHVIGGAVLPRNVWEPIAAAFATVGIEVAALHSMEECLALAAPGGAASAAAVLECNTSRARFVLSDGRAVAQVRRFMIANGDESDVSALVAQLCIELPRTVDWLRELGYQTPEQLVLGIRVDLDANSQEMIRGDFLSVEQAQVGVRMPTIGAMPGLATATLLRELCSGVRRASLLERTEIRLPWRPLQAAGIAAAVLAGGACTWLGVEQLRRGHAASVELAQAESDLGRATTELQRLRIRSGGASAGDGSAELQRALGLRRPVSRLCAEVSNCATGLVHLEVLQFASKDQVVVSGVVEGRSRKEALAALAEFAKSVGTLPFLVRSAQEDVVEVVGQPNRFRFKLGMAWRVS